MKNKDKNTVKNNEGVSDTTLRRLKISTNSKVELLKAKMLSDKGVKVKGDDVVNEALDLYAKKNNISIA